MGSVVHKLTFRWDLIDMLFIREEVPEKKKKKSKEVREAAPGISHPK